MGQREYVGDRIMFLQESRSKGALKRAIIGPKKLYAFQEIKYFNSDYVYKK